VFVGGFDLAAAEVVCGADPVDQFEVLDLIGSLVEKSLVMLEEREEGSRYRMLETIREYAMEKLVGRGEESETAARHCQHFFAFAKQAREGITGAEQGQWVARVETDLDNLRAATALALAGGVDPFVAVKLAVALNGFWMLRGRATEGREVVRASLALPAVQESDMAQAWALYVGATLATSQSDHVQAREMLERCLELRRRLGKEIEIAATLSTLAMSRFQAGDADGAAAGEQEALQLFRKIGDRRGEAIGLLHLGQYALWRGDVDVARDHLEQGLKIAREIGQREIEAECELHLGEHCFEAGGLAAASGRIERSLEICREAADRHGEAKAVWWMGRVALRGGDLLAARAHFAEALRAFQASEMREELLGCLEDHVALLQAEGSAATALRVAAMAVATRQRMALVPSPPATERWAVLVKALRESVPEPEAIEAWEDGAQWGSDEAVRAALALPA